MLDTKIVTDPVSGREIYVNEEFWNELIKEYPDKTFEEIFDMYFGDYGFDWPDYGFNWPASGEELLDFIRGRASIDELLDFANEIRKAGGGELIDELLLSKPKDSNNCLIANALNFDCEVESCDDDNWAMFTDSDLSITIADKVGLKKCFRQDEIWDEEYGEFIEKEICAGVILPDNIKKVALAFDTQIDVELEEYSVFRNKE